MKIKSFTVENYRSIKKSNDLPIYNLSILIGPNNEGKSNILKALVMTLNYITTYHTRGRFSRNWSITHFRRDYDEGSLKYDFERDFPIGIKKIKVAESIIKIIFELTEIEKKIFNRITKKKLQGDLRVRISFRDPHHPLGIGIRDSLKLKTKKTFYEYREQIFRLIRDRIEVSYIPAIRDSEKTIETIEAMITQELSVLESDQRYKNLMSKLEKLQKPILNSLASSLTKEVSEFLPDVKRIHLGSKQRIQRISRVVPDVLVDDGTETPLELKGDGIKSLMAISIIEHVTRKQAAKKNILLVIEEPESHLHPDAIHKLKNVLRKISTKNQVLISTHSPLMVNRSNISRNLLVDKSQVRAAKSISEIRDSLGVKIADNLRSANLVILVEGNDDKQILQKCIEEISPGIQRSLENGMFTFDILNGASHLSQKIGMWHNSLCDVYAFLDHDREGKQAFDQAEHEGLIGIKNSSHTILNGYKESEMEDLISLDVYNKAVHEKYGVNLSTSKEFKNNKHKWSIRVKKSFLGNSKRWNSKIEANVKLIVLEKFLEIGYKGINIHHQKPIKSITKSLEDYLKTHDTDTY